MTGHGTLDGGRWDIGARRWGGQEVVGYLRRGGVSYVRERESERERAGGTFFHADSARRSRQDESIQLWACVRGDTMPMPGVTVSETVQNLNALRLRPGSARASGSAGAPARGRPTRLATAILLFLGIIFCKFASACPPSYPRGYERPADPLRGCTTIAVAPLTSAVIAPTMSAFGARGGRHAPMAQPMAPPAMVELAGLSLPKMRPVRHSNPL